VRDISQPQNVRASQGLVMKLSLKINPGNKQTKYYKYYKCERCGYISIVKNTYCPICEKDGYKLKLK
jgi:rubrerythrin